MTRTHRESLNHLAFVSLLLTILFAASTAASIADRDVVWAVIGLAATLFSAYDAVSSFRQARKLDQ